MKFVSPKYTSSNFLAMKAMKMWWLSSYYTLHHRELLHISSNMLYSCEYQGDNALHFIDAKTIQAVMAMVPHMPAIGYQGPSEWFFLIEKPRFNAAVMTGIEDKLQDKPKDAALDKDNTT